MQVLTTVLTEYNQTQNSDMFRGLMIVLVKVVKNKKKR